MPMDNDEFTREYFKRLIQVGMKIGYGADVFQAAIWKGVSAMVKNDGSCLNEERFWKTAARLLGHGIYEYVPVFDAFYNHGFHETRAFTRPT